MPKTKRYLPRPAYAAIVAAAVIAALAAGVWVWRELALDRVAVIEIEGPIYNFGTYAPKIREALDDARVKAVVLKVNSPGGTVDACFELENLISRLSAVKPVVASFGDAAASGAYLIGSAATEVYTHGYTVTAGLGVLAVWVDASRYYEKEGYDVWVWRSGEAKDEFADWRPPTEGENAYIQSLVDNYAAELFGRVGGNRPDAQLDSVRDGGTIYGFEAVQLKLATAVGSFEDAVKRSAELAGITDYRRVTL